MKSYRSSSTFVTVDLLFHELLPFVQNSFSGLILTLLSHIWMKVGRKLPYKELQIKFDFCHGWPTFSWVIALCSNFVFRASLNSAFTYLNESWQETSMWRVTDQVRLSSWLAYFFMSYCPLFTIRLPDFSRLWFHISECKLVSSNSNCYLLKSTPK